MEKLLLYGFQLNINNLNANLHGLVETVEERYRSITLGSQED